jgi:Ca2+-binding EF-hand superfamily protein
MGQAQVLPEADARMQRAIKVYFYSPKEVAKFYKCFQKVDKDKQGIIKLEDLFHHIDMKRNVYTDTIFELLEIEYSGDIYFDWMKLS